LKQSIKKIKIFEKDKINYTDSLPLDTIVQCFEYDNEFITKNIINDLNWIDQSIVTLSCESLVAIFERNDLNLIEIISSR